MIGIRPDHPSCINLRLSQVHLSKNSSAIFSTTSLALPRLQLRLELQHSQEPTVSKDMIHHGTPAGAKPKKETHFVQMFANCKLFLCLFMLIDLAKVDYHSHIFCQLEVGAKVRNHLHCEPKIMHVLDRVTLSPELDESLIKPKRLRKRFENWTHVNEESWIETTQYRCQEMMNNVDKKITCWKDRKSHLKYDKSKLVSIRILQSQAIHNTTTPKSKKVTNGSCMAWT